MKIDKAEEIIDNMYQKRMRQMEEKTNEGLIIHLGTKVEFTKEEEASVILLRELQILRKKLADSIPKSKVKEKIEETEKQIDDLVQNEDVYGDNLAKYNDLKLKIEVLQELLREE